MSAEGFRLVIPQDMLNRLQKADEKLEQLGRTSENTQQKVIASFRAMADGINPFIQKLNEAQQALANIGNHKGGNINLGNVSIQATQNVDAINKLIDALVKLKMAKKESGAKSSNIVAPIPIPNVEGWTKLQQSINQSEQRVKQLTQSTREYEATLKRIQSGKGGVLSRQEQEQYKLNKLEIDELNKSITLQRQKQQEIIAQNNAIQAQLRLREQLRTFEQNQNSLPNQRQNAEMQQLNAYYRELEKTSKKDEERRIKEEQRSARTAEKIAKDEEKKVQAAERAAQRAAKAEERRIAQITRAKERLQPSTISGQRVNYLLDISRNATSINQLLASIKNLEKAKKDLDTTDKNYKKTLAEINNAINNNKQSLRRLGVETENVRKHQSNLMNHAQQLRRALALVFSVSQITGYVNKMIQIRGEFELQQRSLQAILQNKDEANRIWQQTVDLALRSPFRVKELVTYTKQLAAYRVETEKLHETTRMLSDVSAGLGVDMQRLILAYGQVKAANYLRGTELRQFSEAGINILGELAKYFTELEGRAISVGEVFERVSKRMVAFSDVEEIFKRITSEDGIFYRMQEIQSETVKGLISNLYDQIDLMFNEIGKGNQGTLKTTIKLIGELVGNWRELEPYIKTAGWTFITYFGAKEISKLVACFGKLIISVKTFGVASASAAAINPWVALVTVIGAVVAGIYSASTATDEFTASMQEVDKEVSKSLGESVALYRQLTNTINDSTASLEEQNKAYSNLKSKFGEILPDHLLELDYIKGKGFAYQEAEVAMRAYYDAQAKEFKKSKIMQSTDIYTVDIPEFATQFNEEIEDLEISEEKKLALQQQSAQIITSVVDDILNGAIKVEDGLKEIGLRASKFIGEDIDISKFGEGVFNMYRHQAFDLNMELNGILKKLQVITGLPFETLDESKAADAKNRMQKEVEMAEEYFTKLANIYAKVASGEYSRDVANVEVDKIWSEILGIDGMEKYIPILENALKSLTNTAQKGLFEYKSVLSVIKSGLYADDGGFADIALGMTKGASEAATSLFTNLSEELTKKGEDILRTPMQETIVNAIKYVSDSHKLDDATKNLFAKFIPTGKDQTTTTIRQTVESTIKQFEELKKLYEISRAAGGESLPFVDWLDEQIRGMDALFQSTVKVLATNEKAMPALQQLYGILGGEIKQKGGRDIFEERLRVIKEIYEAYKQLSKTFDDAKSKEGALKKFGDAFQKAWGATPEQMGFDLFSEDGVVKAYNFLINSTKDAKKKIKAELAKGDIILEVETRMQKQEDKEFADQIADMFSGYELSLELQKLNIPQDLAQQLFGVETFDLSQIREKLEKEIADAEKQGGREDFVAERKKELEKVEEMERKAQEERLKRYAKFLTKGFNERINLKIKELRELELLEKDRVKLAPQQYEAAKKGIQSEYNTKILKQEWEEFEKSSQYLNLFDDIENSSNAALRSMLSHLESLKQSMIAAGLPASDLKEILNQIEKVEEELEERTPFATFGKDLGTAVGKIGEYIKARKEEKKLLEDIKNLRQKEKELSPQVAKEQEDAKKTALFEQYGEELHKLAFLKEGTEEYKEQEQVVDDLYRALYPVTTKHQEITEQIDETNQELDDAQSKTKKWKEALKGVGNGIVKFGGHLKEVGSFVSDMSQKWEQAFGLSDRAREDMETIANVAQSAGDMAVGIGKAIADPSDIGAYMQAASGLMGVFATFGQAHDKDKERQIEREIKLVERLQKVYEDLGDTIKNAYSIDTLNEATQMSRENIMAQIEATNRMIEAEQGKKDTDWERIEDWKEDIEELKEAMKELEETRLQELGAFASDENKKSGAEAFLDAWLEAYKQTGDGLSGLNEQFDEFFEDMIKKQLLQRASNKYLSGFYETFDRNIRNWADNEISGEDAINNILKAKDEYMPQLNEWLKRFADSLGVAEDLAGSTAELSGLQAGIQGITEDQADVLASYMNSVRFYVADNNERFTDLITRLFDSEGSSNPMLAELRAQTAFIREIRDSLGGVIRGGHSMGGDGLKVFVS